MISYYPKVIGFDIDKIRMENEEQIKAVGIYTVNIKHHQSVSTKLKVWVVRE